MGSQASSAWLAIGEDLGVWGSTQCCGGLWSLGCEQINFRLPDGPWHTLYHPLARENPWALAVKEGHELSDLRMALVPVEESDGFFKSAAWETTVGGEMEPIERSKGETDLHSSGGLSIEGEEIQLNVTLSLEELERIAKASSRESPLDIFLSRDLSTIRLDMILAPPNVGLRVDVGPCQLIEASPSDWSWENHPKTAADE